MTTRRTFLASSLLAAQSRPTRFQMACMTLPYSAFSLERALTGIQAAGFRHVAWGVSHEKQPLLEVSAAPRQSAQLGRRCRDIGLEPVMMFATTNLEVPQAAEAHQRRIDQAAAAGIPFLLTFGKTTAGNRPAFIETLRSVAAHAQGSGVMVVIKQHGGNTGTGELCAQIVAEVAHPAVKICYDAGNVLDYERQDPIADIKTCWREIRAFNIKDHRTTPRNEDCGPGFGEIDHYKLLAPVMNTGLTIPLTFENIFAPLVPRPTAPEAIDALARRAREYIETVVSGLQTL